MRPAIFVFVIALGLVPVAAQHDDQTDDYEQQDDKYYQQYLEQQEETKRPDPPPETDGPNTEAFIALAEELVRDKNYWSRSSDRYRIQTDDPDLDSKATVELLESFRTFFDGFWPDSVELHPYDEVSRVFLFDSFHKYNKLLGFDARFSDVRPKGHYISGINVMVLRTTADERGGLADTLVHESAHQLIDQRLYGNGYLPSTWVSEGLASYFGYTVRDKTGEFKPGRIGGKTTALLRGGSKAAAGEAGRATTGVQDGREDDPLGRGSLHRRVSGVGRRPAGVLRRKPRDELHDLVGAGALSASRQRWKPPRRLRALPGGRVPRPGRARGALP